MINPSMPVALVPGVLALLPSYSSIEDPVAELRAACLAAVGRLGPRVRVLASGDPGRQVGESLVAAVGAELVDESSSEGASGLLVMGNGSARRTEKAPGFFDERAEAFDASLRRSFAQSDTALAEELWADTGALGVLPSLAEAEVLYDDLPFGVQYWVALWA